MEMKVKELIEKLKKLDQNKEILLYTDGNYLQEDGTFFKLSYSFDDLEINKCYFLETKDEVLVDEITKYSDADDLKEEIEIAKKYMKVEGYEKIIKEGEGYYFEAM